MHWKKVCVNSAIVFGKVVEMGTFWTIVIIIILLVVFGVIVITDDFNWFD
jgi:hypothetical protein